MPCHPKKNMQNKSTPIKATNMPSQSKEYANQNTKYAISTKRICQPKHQVCHLNPKSTPTKTLSTPSQSKETANQNTKYDISIKRIRQPTPQIRCLNQKNTPMWILVLNIDLRALSWGNYGRKFTHFSAYNLKFWKLRWCSKIDKLQVWSVPQLNLKWYTGFHLRSQSQQ